MRFDSCLRAASLVFVLSALPAIAQESTVPEQLVGMVGEWRLEQEDPSLPICALTFTEDESIGGWAIEQHEPCVPPFPAADQMVAWNVDDTDGSVIILDAVRHVTLRLFEDEDGLFVTGPDHQPTFYLMLPYDAEGTGGEADAE